MKNSELYLDMSIQFLNLAQASASQLVENNNRKWVTSCTPISNDDYNIQTQWSDFHIAIPILFNFYHGIELVLKFLISENQEIGRNHNILEMIDTVDTIYKDCEYYLEVEKITSIIKKSTNDIPKNSIINKFLENNNIGIDLWYQFLKYPLDTKGNIFKHNDLINNQESVLDFWREIIKYCQELKELSQKLNWAYFVSLEDRKQRDEFIEKFNENIIPKILAMGTNPQ